MNEAPVLKTERLVLRPYAPKDFEAFADYFASERSRSTDGPVSRLQAGDLFFAGTGRWTLAGHSAWTITRRGEDVGIGLVSLNAPIVLAEPDLGGILWSGFEGRGLPSKQPAQRAILRLTGWVGVRC